MAPRFRLFGAEGWAKRVNLPQRHGQRFAIKLATLRQVGFLVVNVIDFKERRSAFARRGREHRRVGERVALAVHEFARGADGFSADTQNRRLPRGTNPKMAVVEKKVDAVFFELDRKRGGFGDLL